ncbi:MAG: hypothetical protein Q4A74_05040 [Cardiobacteriaceae bacterium]|nr:hypothetical protein [Cardiobacteriaceae bacterium]
MNEGSQNNYYELEYKQLSIEYDLLGMHPREIKTWLLLYQQYLWANESPVKPTFQSMVSTFNDDHRLLRLSMLMLRLHGALLIPGNIPLPQLLDGEQLSMRLLPTQLTLDEILTDDPDYPDFVYACIDGRQFLYDWVMLGGGSLAADDLINRLVDCANTVAKRLDQIDSELASNSLVFNFY